MSTDALPEFCVLDPEPMLQLTFVWSSSLRGSETLFWPQQVPDMDVSVGNVYVVHRHVGETSIHIIISK